MLITAILVVLVGVFCYHWGYKDGVDDGYYEALDEFE